MALFQIALWIVGLITEVLLLGVLSLRRIGRKVPSFVAYVYWTAVTDLIAGLCYYRLPTIYVKVYAIQSLIEGLLLVVVLLDLGRLAISGLTTLIYRGFAAILLILTLGAGGLFWELTDKWTLLSGDGAWHWLLREELTFSLLRIFVLLLIGGIVEFFGRHSLPVGWGKQELQIATGMGIYALASLGQSLATTYQRILVPATFWGILVGAGVVYEGCLVYWLVCFLKPEAEAGEVGENAESGSGAAPLDLWHDKELGEQKVREPQCV